MVHGKITDGDVTELVRSTADAASAYIRGDIQRYLTLIKHGDNYTLMEGYPKLSLKKRSPIAARNDDLKVFNGRR